MSEWSELIPWNGGECPIPEAEAADWLSIRKDGKTHRGNMNAFAHSWQRIHHDSEIVGFHLRLGSNLWVNHDGKGVPDFGECTLIDAQDRDGTLWERVSTDHWAVLPHYWMHQATRNDVIRWRPHGVGADKCSGAESLSRQSCRGESSPGASAHAAPEQWSDWIPHEDGAPCPIPWAEAGYWKYKYNEAVAESYGYVSASESAHFKLKPHCSHYRYRLDRAPACFAPPLMGRNAAMLARDERPETESERAYRETEAWWARMVSERNARITERAGKRPSLLGFDVVAPLAAIGGLWPTE